MGSTNICDSVWYLYSTPGTSYSQLMVAAQKVESKNEDTQEKVRANAMVTTGPGEGMAEPGTADCQINGHPSPDQTRQASSPSSTPGSPWECCCGQEHSGRSTSATQTPAMVGVDLAR